MILNLLKCEIMAFNCCEQNIQSLFNETNMIRVTTLKHLGLRISDDGTLIHNDNIAPVQNAMDKIADSSTTSTSTPLGKAIYAKFRLSSRYLHKIKNLSFLHQQLTSVLQLT